MKIHPSAIVSPKAYLAEDVEVGPFSIIGDNVTIGAGTKITSSVVIEGWTTIGENNLFHPGVVVGTPPQDLGYHGERAYVKIGNDNELREYVTVHRAANLDGVTTVGDGNLLMAYVHVAHNCTVGNQVTIANYAGLAGHSSVGDQAVLGGLVGVHQHAKIGRLCMVGGLSKINKDIPPFSVVDGKPVRIYGTNFRGMRRRGLGADVRGEIRKAMKFLCGLGLTVSQAVQRMLSELEQSPELLELVDFLQHPSRMGVLNRGCGQAGKEQSTSDSDN